MFTVQAAGMRSGKEAVVVRRDDRLVGAAFLPFIEWLYRNVPEHQLAPEQIALVQWYEEQRTQ